MPIDEVELEYRTTDLANRARRENAASLHAKAATTLREALEIVDGFIQRHPGEAKHVQMSASLHYFLATVYNGGAKFEEAVRASDTAERQYGTLIGADGGREAAVLQADVRSRRAYSFMHLGRCASAVADSDRAVGTHKVRAGVNTASGDLGRVLAFNARILADCGDPELAQASAKMARGHLQNAGAVYDPGLASYLRLVDEALAKSAKPQAAKRTLDALLGDVGKARRAVPKDVRKRAQVIRGRLAHERDQGFAQWTVRPSERCAPAVAPEMAEALSDIVPVVIGVMPLHGMVIAREAHSLYAAAWYDSRPAILSGEQGVGLDLQRYGASWLELLETSAPVLREAGNARAAGDYEAWHARIRERLATSGA